MINISSNTAYDYLNKKTILLHFIIVKLSSASWQSIYRKYRLGAWSACMRIRTNGEPEDHGSEVIGHRRRTVDCIDNMGVIIEKKLASEELKLYIDISHNSI